ncbi:MAG TPA: hypothetical protein ENN79_00955, partial [Desulfobacteraceae bacterium]|nr:hypothetical protein [Desulfobacteraceae bacterium]
REEYGKRNFIASGRKVPRTGGIILSCVQTKEELEAILERDPFKIAGIADYEITEFSPTMTADGFEILKEI